MRMSTRKKRTRKTYVPVDELIEDINTLNSPTVGMYGINAKMPSSSMSMPTVMAYKTQGYINSTGSAKQDILNIMLLINNYNFFANHLKMISDIVDVEDFVLIGVHWTNKVLQFAQV